MFPVAVRLPTSQATLEDMCESTREVIALTVA